MQLYIVVGDARLFSIRDFAAVVHGRIGERVARYSHVQSSDVFVEERPSTM